MFISKITIGGKRYAVGDKLRFRKASDLRGYSSLSVLEKGELVEVVSIKQAEHKENTLIGITTMGGKRYNGWHDLDGILKKNSGYYIERCHVVNNFELVPNSMVVSENFPFREKNLKNMKCKIISPMPNSLESVVEFKENIGGCGADGLGKGGHCLVVPNNILLPVEEQKLPMEEQKKKTKEKEKSK